MYIAKDCHGWALQFTGSGKSVQVADADADTFNIAEAAEGALCEAGEKGGRVFEIHVNE